MAVKIRLMRVGKRKQPSYRVVVADSRSPRDGRILETIGRYGPRHEPSQVEIDGDRALDWLRKGAQPTESVQKLLTISGVWATFEAEKAGPVDTKLNRRGYLTGRGPTPTKGKKHPEPVAAAPAAAAAAAAAAPAAAAPAAAAPAEAAPAAAAEEAPAEVAAEVDAPEPETAEEQAE